jgi:hypothetical protein
MNALARLHEVHTPSESARRTRRFGGARLSQALAAFNHEERAMEHRGGTTDNGDAGRDLEAGAREQLEELRQRIGDAGERLVELIRERPGTSILIALGAGFLIGRMLRS